MNDVIFFALLGLAGGSLYALLASGLVCSFKGAGVINFALGAMAMYPAFTMTELQRDGVIQLPLVDFLPTSSLNVPVEITRARRPRAVLGRRSTLSLAMAALLGVLVHYLVFRPLRHAPPLGKVIGSLGVLLYLQGVALLNFGETVRQPPPVLPSDPWQDFLWFGRALPRVNIWLLLVAVAHGRGAVVLLPAHPVRRGDPCRSRQREGRHPARLLTGSPRPRQLGAVGARRRHGRHPGRRP